MLIAIGVYFGFTKDIPFTHGYYLHAVFESSNNLRPGSPVRIAGVNVGKVKSVERYRDTDLTEVTMEIGEAGLPIHQDATLKIRPRIFLEGNFFVDLRPGSPSAPEVPDGGTIGSRRRRRRSSSTSCSPRCSPTSAPTCRRVLQEFGKALDSKPTAEQDATLDPDVRGKTGAQGLNGSYTYAPDALKGSALVNSALLGTEPHDLSRMIAGDRAPHDGAAHERARAAGADRQLQHDGGRVRRAERRADAGGRPARPDAHDGRRRVQEPRRVVPADARLRARLHAGGAGDARDGRGRLTRGSRRRARCCAETSWAACSRSCSRRRRTSRGWRASRSRSCRSSTSPTAASRERSSRPATSASETARSRRAAADGSIVENYKEFWYAMVGLAGEGANFDGNGSMIRAGARRRLVPGRASADRELPDSAVVGNANRRPLGTSPLYPDADSRRTDLDAPVLPPGAAGRQRAAGRAGRGAAERSRCRRRRRCRTRSHDDDRDDGVDAGSVGGDAVRSAIRKHLRDFIAILVLVLIAGFVGLYVLAHQRTTLPGWVPLVGRDVFVLKGEFATAQAITPGQGQTVDIAGVAGRRRSRRSISSTAARS